MPRLASQPFLSDRAAKALVFGTSFCVLVLEILAGRLLAPLIGVSLETFTGIIGTVLAGIALGNSVGGRMADSTDASTLLGPTILAGGALTWIAPLVTSALGPVGNADPITIVFLAAITFFGPAAVLSAVTPMVAKLRLGDLDNTGRVVGSLSAAGTAGALAGTFLTGFVLVAAFPTRQLIFGVGAILVLVGAILTGRSRITKNLTSVVVVAVLGVGALTSSGPCDAETAYACVQIVPDPERQTGRSLVLNGTRNSYVDLVDPSFLDFRYMRLFADVAAGLPTGPVDALHLGGAGFTYPRHLNTVRPGSTGTVLEIDAELIDVAVDDLGLEISETMEIISGDARLSIGELDDDSYHLIVGDAFSGLTIPWHLTTVEFVRELDRVLRPDGVVVANLIDGGEVEFARAAMSTYRSSFEHVALVVPDGGIRDRGRNLIMIASHEELPSFDIDPSDGHLLTAAETNDLIDDAAVLTDDFAPVDQLRLGP